MRKEKNILSKTAARFLIYAAMFLPLVFFRELTPANELKYLSIADEAMNEGHTWCMYNNGEVYADKPPFYFWLAMMSKDICGEYSSFFLAFFSLIPALITVYLFDKWCGTKLRGRYKYTAEVSLLSTAWFLGSAVVLRMDMLMTMFITLAMFLFWKIYSGKHSQFDKFLMGFCVFMAIFTKGPVGLLMPLVCTATFLAVQRNFKAFTKIWNMKVWLPIIAGCLIWWTFTYAEGGRAYLHEMLIHQTFGRAVNSFSHSRSIFYYFYTIWYAMAPWSLLTIGIIVWASIKKQCISELTQFFIIVSLSFVLMMSLFSCKLQVYLLPCFGFINYAAFLILYKMTNTSHELHSRARLIRKIVAGGSWAILTAVFVISIAAPEWMNRLILGF